MTPYWLKITLASDTAFGRGDGVAGLVDAEVQHDDYGLPYLGGKTLKALLSATCAEIIAALNHVELNEAWEDAAAWLLGEPGSGVDEVANLHVGDARLPTDLRRFIAYQVDSDPATTREDILESLTGLRRQTAMDPVTGAPQQETLRTTRVIIRGTPFFSRLDFLEDPDEAKLALLAACVKALRRVGSSRNRGLGWVKTELYDTNPIDPGSQPVTERLFTPFEESLQS